MRTTRIVMRRLFTSLAVIVAVTPVAGSALAGENRYRPIGMDGVGSPTPVKKPRWTLQDYESLAAANSMPGNLV